jgi:hypothetical protein
MLSQPIDWRTLFFVGAMWGLDSDTVRKGFDQLRHDGLDDAKAAQKLIDILLELISAEAALTQH